MSRHRIVLAVCTYHRNEALAVLLGAVLRNADDVRDRAAIGVVIVDDSKDRIAQPVAQAFADRFELGLEYRQTGSGNISIARNMAIETAMPLGDWIAMTDDDCEPVHGWLRALLDVQAATGADIVTGLMIRRPGVAAAPWIVDQGFLKLGEFDAADGQELSVAFTNNCLIRAAALRDRPLLRFDRALGVLGGEDMVFFTAARESGMTVRFSRDGIVHENEPAERLTFRYQLGRYFWQGNSSYVTLTRGDVSRSRMLVHGIAAAGRALGYPAGRLARGQAPHFRYGAALFAGALGSLAGVLGMRTRHH